MFSCIDEKVVGGIRIEIRRHTLETPWTYSQLNLRQLEVAEQARNGKGRFILSELAPVITLGRRTPVSDLLMTPEQLSRLGIGLEQVNRGGLATYHGPGQWVLFPVERLETLVGDRRGVRKAVGALLNIALAVGQVYDPRAEIRHGCELGVWTPLGKFASVGIQIEKGVLLHGLAINGLKTELSFTGLRPCGMDSQMDFLVHTELEFNQLGQLLVSKAVAEFERIARAGLASASF